MIRRGSFLPVFPAPAAVIMNFNPAAKSYLALGDFIGILFADGVFANGAIVGRDF